MNSFLLIVAVYRKSLTSSPAIASVANAMCGTGRDVRRYSLFVHDNSPESQIVPDLFPIPLDYLHDGSNPGLSVAYNRAFSRACAHGAEWIILLDEDTELTADYFRELEEVVARDASLSAFVPRVISHGRVVSPHQVCFSRVAPVPSHLVGVPGFEVNAINSGTAVRRSALEKIGGFSQEFWLDFLDYWFFHQLWLYDMRVYIGRSTLEHELSVLDYRNVSLTRYKNILSAEWRFISGFKNLPERAAYRIRLLVRILKHAFIGPQKPYWRETAVHFARTFSTRG
jgi:GT2 family glycosyltransferase